MVFLFVERAYLHGNVSKAFNHPYHKLSMKKKLGYQNVLVQKKCFAFDVDTQRMQEQRLTPQQEVK